MEAIFSEDFKEFFLIKYSFMKDARKLSPAPTLSIDSTFKDSTFINSLPSKTKESTEPLVKQIYFRLYFENIF